MTGDYCGPECDRLTAVYWAGPETPAESVTGMRELPEIASDRACGICGEREGSVYAKRCCTDEQMVEV